MRQSWDNFIFIVGIPIWVRWHLYDLITPSKHLWYEIHWIDVICTVIMLLWILFQFLGLWTMFAPHLLLYIWKILSSKFTCQNFHQELWIKKKLQNPILKISTHIQTISLCWLMGMYFVIHFSKLLWYASSSTAYRTLNVLVCFLSSKTVILVQQVQNRPSTW